MPMIFYPHQDELESSTLDQKLEILMESAERFKAVVLDTAKKPDETSAERKRLTPREVSHVYNWEEIASLFRELRELPETSPASKLAKGDRLMKLAAIYEVLRGAKMTKLEAVRLALINEANQLRGTPKVV